MEVTTRKGNKELMIEEIGERKLGGTLSQQMERGSNSVLRVLKERISFKGKGLKIPFDPKKESQSEIVVNE